MITFFLWHACINCFSSVIVLGFKYSPVKFPVVPFVGIIRIGIVIGFVLVIGIIIKIIFFHITIAIVIIFVYLFNISRLGLGQGYDALEILILYGPTFYATPIDLCIIFQYTYIYMYILYYVLWK